MTIAPTAYDEVLYPGWSYRQSHPDRLATLGRLFGLPTADPEACRVLELGCGDGGNLLPIALACPRSLVVCIDLAPSAIDRERPHLSATAPVGTSRQMTPTRKRPSANVTWVRLNPFSSVRNTIHTGIHSWKSRMNQYA